MSLELKIEAAAAALETIEEGGRLGIGTGSTADEFTKLLGAKVAQGFDVIGVPTSVRTKELCDSLSIPITTLDELPELDVVVDGADEADHQLQLIKGGGGALLREKIVAHASQKMIVIADDTKLVETLGAFPLPIEVNPFGLKATWQAIEGEIANLGMEAPMQLRGGDSPFLTDGGHYIVDASFGHISDASALSESLLNIPGVVEHGLFLGYADMLFLAGQSGVRCLGIEQAPH